MLLLRWKNLLQVMYRAVMLPLRSHEADAWYRTNRQPVVRLDTSGQSHARDEQCSLAVAEPVHLDNGTDREL